MARQTLTSLLTIKEKHPLESRWVLFKGRIGIATQVTQGHATFNAVGEDGITYMQCAVPTAELKQAHYNDIPDIRKPTKERAQLLGYEID